MLLRTWLPALISRRQYSLDMSFPLPVDVYREWFHFNKPDQRYYPDALIPDQTALPIARYRLADHRIAKQTAEAFWLDLWVPADTKPGTYHGKATLKVRQ